MHDRVRDDTAPVLCTILKTADIIGKGSRVDLELKKYSQRISWTVPIQFFFPTRSLFSNELPYLPFCTLAAAVILP